MIVSRCWKQEVELAVEVELLLLSVLLSLASGWHQPSWGQNCHHPVNPKIISIFRFASLAVSHQNTIPLFFVFLSFVIWLYDCITDMVREAFKNPSKGENSAKGVRGVPPFSAKKKSVKNWPKNCVFWAKNTVFSEFLASCRPLRGGGGYPPFPLRNFC